MEVYTHNWGRYAVLFRCPPGGTPSQVIILSRVFERLNLTPLGALRQSNGDIASIRTFNLESDSFTQSV